ncbi:MAG: carboxy terminal-processing peptidase [Syntrophothermus sp.]
MNRIKIFFIILLISLPLYAQTAGDNKDKKTDDITVPVLNPGDVQQREDQFILPLLSRYHYKKTDINDSLSSVILDEYLNTLDQNRVYFLASDIENFNKYRHELDDDIKIARLKPAYDIFNIYLNRIKERQDYIKTLLSKEFDFTVDESMDVERKNQPWAKSQDELNEVWRKRIKYEALREKLDGKDWPKIAETLEKRYNNFERRMFQLKSEDVFQLFINQFLEAIDPHTQYFSPATSENFKMNMSLSLEGIGASLQSEDEYTIVREVIAGGPAFKSKLIKVNDKIISVAQGENGEMVDVIGKNIDDVVKLIRGPKGTVVRLQIIPADGGVNAKPKEITLVRDKIKLEDKAAKKEVLEINNNSTPFRIGIITLPEFYFDFEAQARGEKDYKSTTRDVRKLIRELKDQKVDGIVLDLRDNGGGSLQEAIDLTGLFIKDGPAVQVKNSDGSVELGVDQDPTVYYDGPLAVLVNRSSASASEIFAAAIQDYKRGVIVGEQTYGKGTVQNLIDLNRLFKNDNDKMGQLKLTIAKFYRVNGGSTQRRGVMPDILYPSTVDTTEFGESTSKSSLQWDQIAPADFTIYNKIGDAIPQLLGKHQERMKSDMVLKSYTEEIEEAKEAHEKKTVSLMESKLKKERDDDEEKRMARINERRKAQGLKVLNKGEVEAKDEKSDPMLRETANIVSDLFLLASNRTTAK